MTIKKQQSKNFNVVTRCITASFLTENLQYAFRNKKNNYNTFIYKTNKKKGYIIYLNVKNIKVLRLKKLHLSSLQQSKYMQHAYSYFQFCRLI